jgi:hypothetical protein
VNDLAKRAVVQADGAPAIDGPRHTAAAGASRGGDADGAPRRQRITAAITDRRRDGAHRLPAGRADRTGCRMIEQARAAGADRGEQNGEEGVGGVD